MSSRAKRILQRGLLVCLSGLLVCGAAEGVVRRWFPHPRYPGFIEPDPDLGHLPRPGWKGRATNMFGSYDTAISINRDGFRDRDHSLETPPQTIRIAFLGDSFTMAQQVEENQCFVRRIETLLNRPGMLNVRVECMNFGVDGYCAQQELACYRKHVRKYRPSMVVLAFFVGNDFLENVSYLTDQNLGRPYFHVEDGRLVETPADLKKMTENRQRDAWRYRSKWTHRIQLKNLIQQILWDFQHPAKKSPGGSATENQDQARRDWVGYYEPDSPVARTAEPLTIALVRKLQDEVVLDGGRLAVMLIGGRLNVEPDRFQDETRSLGFLKGLDSDRPFKLMVDAFPEIAKENGFLDTRDCLRRAQPRGNLFFPRDGHYSVVAHEAVAEEAAKWLTPRLSVTARGPGMANP